MSNKHPHQTQNPRHAAEQEWVAKYGESNKQAFMGLWKAHAGDDAYLGALMAIAQAANGSRETDALGAWTINKYAVAGSDAGNVDVNSAVYAKARADLTAAGYNFGLAVPKN